MIETAASVAAAGMDPMAFLEERDPLRRQVMTEIAAEFQERSEAQDRSRAVQISNAIWGAVKKKS